MDPSELANITTLESLTEEITQNISIVRQLQHTHDTVMRTRREDIYKGHHIVIRTSYEIEVDSVSVVGHVVVTNDGNVHYHGIPNLSFASAVDLVRRIIDVFPDSFPLPKERNESEGEV